jgi:hypothetical protein
MIERSFATATTLVLALFAAASGAQGPAPYAGQQSRAIKALAPEEIRDYEGGKGMGFAKAAELNGYPGPAHVLELAAKLELSAEQRERTEALFRRMEADAIAQGRRLVEEERELDRAFAERSVTPASLAEATRRLGELQARLRQVHLEAHLEQVALLTPPQVRRYVELRGYGASAGAKPHAGHH